MQKHKKNKTCKTCKKCNKIKNCTFAPAISTSYLFIIEERVKVNQQVGSTGTNT